MKKNRAFFMALVLILCLWGKTVAFAAQTGSLKIVNISHDVMVYHVADSNGTLTGDFQGCGVDALEGAEHAKSLAQYVHERDLTGQYLQPQEGSVFIPSLNEGFYLVCSVENEIAPFLLQIPTQIGDTQVYDVLADPKNEEPEQPPAPTTPVDPEPQIPQTGRSVLPKLVLLAAGLIMIAAGIAVYLRGKKAC